MSASAKQNVFYIHEIPPFHKQLLCDHLDELKVWSQLAVIMSLKPAEVQAIRRQVIMGNSPSDELLKIWGGQYNHTVTELFYILKKQGLYPAMRMLKEFVERKYHIMIPSSQPVISDLMAPNLPESTKIQNCSEVSNSNNSSSIYTSSKESNSVSSAEKSTTLNERNVKKYASSILEINYFELAAATHNWNEKFILGKGGFGTVYRGYWKHTDVAIKQIHYRGPDGRESARVQIQQSLNELKYLNSCRHDNVLPLYGYSIKGEKPCLVYQLMKGGSLEQRLNSKKLPPLTWQERINICLGTARGINYLHTFREKPLIHGDIKPANVLLDVCLHPKIGDFGLAREGPNTINASVEVTQVFGTKPYLPPEFLNSRKLSTQVDTFSFGVLLLECFTGLRAYDKNRDNVLLTKHIVNICATTNGHSIDELIAKNIPFSTGEKDMCKRFIQLGLECIAETPRGRPEMEHVLNIISNYQTFSNLQDR